MMGLQSAEPCDVRDTVVDVPDDMKVRCSSSRSQQSTGRPSGERGRSTGGTVTKGPRVERPRFGQLQVSIAKADLDLPGALIPYT